MGLGFLLGPLSLNFISLYILIDLFLSILRLVKKEKAPFSRYLLGSLISFFSLFYYFDAYGGFALKEQGRIVKRLSFIEQRKWFKEKRSPYPCLFCEGFHFIEKREHAPYPILYLNIYYPFYRKKYDFKTGSVKRF